MKFISIVLVLLLGALFAPTTLALDPINVDISSVEVEGIKLDATSPTQLTLDRGQIITVDIVATFAQVLNGAMITAYLQGYEFDSIQESTTVFDVTNASMVARKLQLQIPTDMDQDSYALRIEVSGRGYTATEKSFTLKIAKPNRDVTIKDLFVRPGDSVRAGTALLAQARLENFGAKDESDLRVILKIPELGLQQIAYIDELTSDDEKNTEELYFSIPACAAPGNYQLQAQVDFAQGHSKSAVKTFPFVITEGTLCNALTGPKSLVTVGGGNSDATQGDAVIVPFNIKNNDRMAKTYQVTVAADAALANYMITPGAAIVVKAGETVGGAVQLLVSSTAASGAHVTTVAIRSGEEIVGQSTITTTVTALPQPTSGLTDILLILVIFVVILTVATGAVIVTRTVRANTSKN